MLAVGSGGIATGVAYEVVRISICLLVPLLLILAFLSWLRLRKTPEHRSPESLEAENRSLKKELLLDNLVTLLMAVVQFSLNSFPIWMRVTVLALSYIIQVVATFLGVVKAGKAGLLILERLFEAALSLVILGAGAAALLAILGGVAALPIIATPQIGNLEYVQGDKPLDTTSCSLGYCSPTGGRWQLARPSDEITTTFRLDQPFGIARGRSELELEVSRNNCKGAVDWLIQEDGIQIGSGDLTPQRSVTLPLRGGSDHSTLRIHAKRIDKGSCAISLTYVLNPNSPEYPSRPGKPFWPYP